MRLVFNTLLIFLGTAAFAQEKSQPCQSQLATAIADCSPVVQATTTVCVMSQILMNPNVAALCEVTVPACLQTAILSSNKPFNRLGSRQPSSPFDHY